MAPKQVDIKVRGTDLFGASFLESAPLVSVADDEIHLFMWRPVAEGAPVELNHDNENHSMFGQIMRITTHLNGAQTVLVKIHLPISKPLSGEAYQEEVEVATSSRETAQCPERD